MTLSDRSIKRYLVWVCCGCDDCEPPDGSQRSAMPCDGPSQDGMVVVNANAYDNAADCIEDLKQTVVDLRDALGEIVNNWIEGGGDHFSGTTAADALKATSDEERPA